MFTLYDAGPGVRDIVITRGGQLYYTDGYRAQVNRINLDGTHFATIVSTAPRTNTTEESHPDGLEYDEHAGKLYWCDMSRKRIERSDLDGNAREVVVSNTLVRAFVLDPENQRLYYSAVTSATIVAISGCIRARELQGTGDVTVVQGIGNPWLLALDAPAGKLYWLDHGQDNVKRSNVDGTQMEILYAAGCNCNPGGLAVDSQNALVYWGQDHSSQDGLADLMRMGTDGQNAMVLVSNILSPTSIHILPDELAFDVIKFTRMDSDGELSFFQLMTNGTLAIESAQFLSDETHGLGWREETRLERPAFVQQVHVPLDATQRFFRVRAVK